MVAYTCPMAWWCTIDHQFHGTCVQERHGRCWRSCWASPCCRKALRLPIIFSLPIIGFSCSVLVLTGIGDLLERSEETMCVCVCVWERERERERDGSWKVQWLQFWVQLVSFVNSAVFHSTRERGDKHVWWRLQVPWVSFGISLHAPFIHLDPRSHYPLDHQVSFLFISLLPTWTHPNFHSELKSSRKFASIARVSYPTQAFSSFPPSNLQHSFGRPLR